MAVLPWEHSKCGPGMESRGFTYHPAELKNHGQWRLDATSNTLNCNTTGLLEVYYGVIVIDILYACL